MSYNTTDTEYWNNYSKEHAPSDTIEIVLPDYDRSYSDKDIQAILYCEATLSTIEVILYGKDYLVCLYSNTHLLSSRLISSLLDCFKIIQSYKGNSDFLCLLNEITFNDKPVIL